eukprot:Sspe_Gene.98844::Locus_72242_Transcript_1_1_Confidence_1.000_Length_661::g.98844::m.98844
MLMTEGHRMPGFLLVLAAVATAVEAGSLMDLEHIVVLTLNDGSSLDHMLGKLNGVRGFNERASPPLPSGKSIWYQPEPVLPLCGCDCDVHYRFDTDGLSFLPFVLSRTCPQLREYMKVAVPPVPLVQGEKCEDVMPHLLWTSYEGFRLGDLVDKRSTCDPSLEIVGLGHVLPMPLNGTRAECVASPVSDFSEGYQIWNGGRMDSWN